LCGFLYDWGRGGTTAVIDEDDEDEDEDDLFVSLFSGSKGRRSGDWIRDWD
jgi:hypothetical protein